MRSFSCQPPCYLTLADDNRAALTDLFDLLDIDQSENEQQPHIDVRLGQDLPRRRLLVALRRACVLGRSGFINLHGFRAFGDGRGRGRELGRFGREEGDEGVELGRGFRACVYTL